MGADEEKISYGENPADPSRQKRKGATARSIWEVAFVVTAHSAAEDRKGHGKHAAGQNDPTHFFVFHCRFSLVFGLAVCGPYSNPSSTKHRKVR
jgi:hypothetical protein